MRTATYHYRLSDYRGGFIAHAVKVEIIGESDKSCQIRYLEPGTSGQYEGTVKWVRKRNVKEPTAPIVWAAPVEIKLPYKD
jgi:hypothetical protein